MKASFYKNIQTSLSKKSGKKQIKNVNVDTKIIKVGPKHPTKYLPKPAQSCKISYYENLFWTDLKDLPFYTQNITPSSDISGDPNYETCQRY